MNNKKNILILTLFLVILIIPQIYSLEIQMSSQIPQGETTIAKLEGNFLDSISKENIEFYRGAAKVPFVYDVGQINGIYYIYFQTSGKSQNNYSISIQNIRYYNGSSISNQPISKNFTITSETADFSISKGFVITGENFSIFLQNLNSDSLIIKFNTEILSGSFGNLEFYFQNNLVENSFTIFSGETEELEIHLQNINETTIRNLILSSENTEYEIPIYIIAQNLPQENPENNSENETLNNPEEINETENETEDDGGSFWDLFKKKNETENSETNSENNSDEYEIIIDDNGNEYAVDNNGNIINAPASSKTCSELKGSVCSSNQICQNDNSTYASDAKCCLSSCVKKTSNKNTKIIGWVIIGVILILLIWFKIKFGKTRRRKFSFPR